MGKLTGLSRWAQFKHMSLQNWLLTEEEWVREMQQEENSTPALLAFTMEKGQDQEIWWPPEAGKDSAYSK